MDQAAKVCAARAGQERAGAALQRALADPDKGTVPTGNTTDPHCRIMPAKAGGYMCARNLQALASDRQIILAMLLHDNPIDVGALHPLLKTGRASLDAIGITTPIGKALFDAGYACEASLLAAVHNEAAACGRDQASGKTIPAAWAGMAATTDTPGARGSLQEAPGHHRARLRAAVCAHGTEPELPRRDAPHRAPPVGHHPQPAECFRSRQRCHGGPAAREAGPERRLTPPGRHRDHPPQKGSSRPCQPKP
jgi:hypothetical protein